MKKETLGEVLRQRRHMLRLTQRELAQRLGVKPSHVAYLESGRRRPSLSLVGRLSVSLGLPSERLLLLAHPEAGALLGRRRPSVDRGEKFHAWRRFVGDKALLALHQVKPRELKVLSQVNLLGRVSAPRDYLFILRAIRQALEEQ